MRCKWERPGRGLSGSFSRLSLYIMLSGWLSFGVYVFIAFSHLDTPNFQTLLDHFLSTEQEGIRFRAFAFFSPLIMTIIGFLVNEKEKLLRETLSSTRSLAMINEEILDYNERLEHEIHERVQAEEKLRKSEERYRSLVESTEDSVYLVDRDCRYLFINRRHQARLGVAGESYRHRTYRDYHSEEEARWFAGKVGEVFSTGRAIRFEHQSSRDGRYFLLTMSPVRKPSGDMEAVNIISKNITELKEMEKQLRMLTLTDELTGLHNRRGFYTLAEHQLNIVNRTGRGIYVLYIDVNNLKEINDRHGHEEGDRLLADTAGILRENFRSSDLIARIGGDEFVILPVDKEDCAAGVIGMRLKERLDEYNRCRGREGYLSLSVGMAYYDPAKPCSLDQLLRAADRSMYEKKLEARQECPSSMQTYLLFGEFLLEKELITLDDISRARELQKRHNVLVRDLARERGSLTEEDIEQMMNYQDDHLYFGEALVKLGVMSEERLAENLSRFESIKTRQRV
jgi:diguanylate cyclase (GGDEF)-like protein/PAS domain S-box-containing protein